MDSQLLKSMLFEGQVIPAHPLALTPERKFDEKYQRALTRYYLDCGVGGLAVGVHTTQFEIREPQHALFKPVLSMAIEEISSFEQKSSRELLKIAGVVGKTSHAIHEVELAKSLGYDIALLSLAAFKDSPNDVIIDHCLQVSKVMPIMGFYLQPSVGGRILEYGFWRRFCEIENVVAIKIAPFNRYYSLDVIRSVVEAGRTEDIALYTGNDDNIIADLFSVFQFGQNNDSPTVQFCGGLLGHWAVWTKKVVEIFNELKILRSQNKFNEDMQIFASQITDCNTAFFDVKNDFKGCIVGVNEVLRRQGLLRSNVTLNPKEELTLGQSAEIDRVYRMYPQLNDDEFITDNLQKWLS